MGIWGLGIGDWGLGPIPNPHYYYSLYFYEKLKNKKLNIFNFINKFKIIIIISICHIFKQFI